MDDLTLSKTVIMENQEKTTIKIDPATAAQFKSLAQKWRINHSNTLQLMLDFFMRNGISPSEDLRPNMKSLETQLSQQIEALKAILLNIETTKIRPIHAMLELLFQSNSNKKGILQERKELRAAEPSTTKPPLRARDTYRDPKHHHSLRTLQKLMRHAQATKAHPDKVHLRITLSEAEFQQLQTYLKLLGHVS